MAIAGPSTVAKRNAMKPLVIPPPGSSPTSSPQTKASLSSLLRHYETPGVPPPSARVDPTLKTEEPTTKFWHVWKYGAAAVGKGFELAGDILSHHVYGPKKKSWGIEMTIVTSIMRDVARHSHLVDIALIRKLMSFSGLIPLPSDALVTPVTFRVRRRRLRGILADLDTAETGKRELAGEWVVGKRLWRRLQSEWKANGKEPRGESEDPKRKEMVILYVHGGAYYLFDTTTHRMLTIPLSKYVGARLFAINYRLAPETQFPGPLHDVVSSYFRLIDDLHIPPENVLIAGDSAGGALCLALMMYLRDNKYPLPAGAMLFSPWVDLTMSCDSWDSNAAFDVIPRPRQGDPLDPIYCYLGARMKEYLTHPYASPLFGDFTGLPPMLITAGDAEVLRDEITLLAHKATLAGVDVRHELYEDGVHVFQAFPFLESSRKSFVSCRDFVKNLLPLWRSHSPKVLATFAENELSEEINSDPKLVDGDGVEVDDGEASWTPSINQEDDSDRSSQEEPSWAQKNEINERSPWPSPPQTDDENDFIVPSNPSATETGWQSPILRIRSTLSALVDNTTASFGVGSQLPTSPTKTVRAHRRAPSLQQTHFRPPNSRRSSYQRASPIDMESVQHPAPPPLLRRNTQSHPDISSLCQNWADSGPANRTVNYKSLHAQSLAGRSRRNSQAIRPLTDIFTPL